MLSFTDDVIFENDAARTVKVFVDGIGPYKNTAGLKRVALEVYISRLHKRDEKAVQLCRLLHDRIEVLEDTIKDSKVK